MEKLKNIHFNIYQFDLCFTAPAKFCFSHARSVYQLLCNALRVHPLVYGLIPYPVESGKIFYKENQPYRFYLTTVGNRDAELCRIVAGLTDFENWAKPLSSFRNRIILENIKQLDFPDWIQEAEQLKGIHDLTLQFVTPLRIRRETKKGYFDAGYFNPETFLIRLYKHLSGLTEFCFVNEKKENGITFPPLPAVKLISNRLVWLDIPGKPALGGALGKIDIKGDFGDWIIPLILGQYLHCGKNTSFGLGRYLIVQSKDRRNLSFTPSFTLSDYIYDQQNFLSAFQNVKENNGMPGTDDQSIDDFSVNLYENLASLIRTMKNNSYRSEPLLGIIVNKEENPRALAIPTVKDRIAQRATVNKIYDSVEQILEDCSYAYRKGFSRYQARRALEIAYKEGYRYVLEADIDDFFDTVDWNILFSKLEALFPHEKFVDWIKDWVRQSVLFETYKINRSQGLPQGAVISPLLANLYLDEFDEAIRKEGFRLIRYADDFVVVCKTRQKAEQALCLVKKKLGELALSLNKEKTNITHFDRGFRYLGFLFCRSVSLEVPKDKKRQINEDVSTDWGKNIAPYSWLAALREKTLKTIIHPEKRSYRLAELHVNNIEAEIKRIVYITQPKQKVSVKKMQLIISEWREDENAFIKVKVFPLKQIKSLVIIGRSRFSVPALLSCAQNDIPVYFCRRNGELITASLPLADGELWRNGLLQMNRNEQEDFVLNFSKRIVRAKIQNCRSVLRRRLSDQSGEEFLRLKTYMDSCENKTSVDSLRGIEGKAAADYFKMFASLVDEQWEFKRRQKHPAPDAVNALLSFGYTLLYHHITTVLYTVGLNPVIGIYHKTSERYFALAADLQEEFRFIVDTLVLTMLNEKMVKEEDFLSGRRVLFKDDFRKRYIVFFEKKISSEFTYYGDGQKYSYHGFFEKQAEKLKQYIKGNTADYEPLTIR